MTQDAKLESEVLERYPGEDSGPALKAIGWVILLTGVICGVWVLGSFSSVEVPSYIPSLPPERTTNPLGVIVGIGIIVQSLVSALMCFALGAAAENTAILRREAFYLRQQRATVTSADK